MNGPLQRSWLTATAAFLFLVQGTAASHPDRSRLSFSWNTRRVQGVLELVTVIPPMVIISIWFWRRRHHHPVKGRMPRAQTVALLMSTFWAASLGLSDLLHGIVPCVYSYWAISLSAYVTATVYLLRTWNLYFRHGLTDERLTQFELTLEQSANRPSWVEVPLSIPSEDTTPAHLWFTRHRYLAGNRFAVRWISGGSALGIALCSLFTIADEDLREAEVIHCDDSTRWIVLVAVLCMCIAVFIVMAWKIRHIIDGYWIKEELKATATVAAVGMIFASIFGVNTTTSESFSPSSLSVILTLFLNAIISGAWPIRRSYNEGKEFVGFRSSRSSLVGVGLQGQDLDDVLEDEIARAAFEKFLIAEFAVENLLFYVQAREYQDVFNDRSTEENLRFMDNIYEQFLLESSMFEINLPGTIKTAIDKEVASILKEFPNFKSRASVSPSIKQMSEQRDVHPSGLNAFVFKDALSSISELLRHDSLPRFLRSGLFRKAMKMSTRLRAETNRIVQDTMFQPVVSVASEHERDDAAVNLSLFESKSGSQRAHTHTPSHARTPSSGYSRQSSGSSNPNSARSSTSRPFTFGLSSQIPSLSAQPSQKQQSQSGDGQLETLEEVAELERLSMSSSRKTSSNSRKPGLSAATPKHKQTISDVPEPTSDLREASERDAKEAVAEDSGSDGSDDDRGSQSGIELVDRRRDSVQD